MIPEGFQFPGILPGLPQAEPTLAQAVQIGGATEQTREDAHQACLKLEDNALRVAAGTEPLDRNAQRRFERTLTPLPEERRSRSARAPPQVVSEILNDVHSFRLWFARWDGKGENWGDALVHEQILRRDITDEHAGHAWLTFAQVQDLYKCPIVAQAICSECAQDGNLWRKHPTVPHIESAKQFWVCVNEGMTKRLEDVISKGVSMKSAVEMDEALQIASRLRVPTSSQAQLPASRPGISAPTSSQAGAVLAGGADRAGGEAPADSAAEVSGAAREKMLKGAALARKKAEATAERIQKQAQAKEEKQRAKESTHGKGIAWLAGCQKKLSDIAGISVQCESTDVDEATRTLYKEKMNGHRQEVVNLRSAIELALGGQDDMVISDGLSKAEAVIEAFKADRQAWNVIYRLATKKAS